MMKMCNSCGWEAHLVEIEEMLEDENYEFASDTLEGIRDWIEENNHITENQQMAIENISNSLDRNRQW